MLLNVYFWLSEVYKEKQNKTHLFKCPDIKFQEKKDLL